MQRRLALRSWGETTALAYEATSGTTHLLSADAFELLGWLQQEAPEGASFDDLLAACGIEPSAGLPADEIATGRSELEQSLASLTRLGLLSRL